MLSLNDRKWKEFSIADIFIIKSGKRLTTADMDIGNLPFIGATELNNGVTNWINTPNETLDRNVLGVNYNGSVAEAFYHPYSCVFSDDVKRLHLKNADDGKYILLFCKVLIQMQKVKYTYGYKFNGNRMARQKILLPITDDGQPDYSFMEQYIREREDKLKQKYIAFIGNNYQIGGGGLPSLEKKVWKAFVIGDLFDSYTGTDLIISKITEGEIPVISHAATNNGIACYSAVIERRPIFSHNNTISLADRGNFKAFVQKTDFYIGTRVKALVSKNVLSKAVLIFIANSIDKQAVKFSYGYNATDNIDKLHIMLPITDDGQPDYEYMEQYIKAVMFGKYKKYLNYQNCLTK